MTALLGEAATEGKAIRLRLREATASLHAHVDEHMGSFLRQGREGYAQFLTASARAVLPLERALLNAGVSDIISDWPSRSRSAALLADMSTLSDAPPSYDDYDDARLREEAYMMGVLYVLEGSRLGARVLLRMIESEPDHGCRLTTHYLSHGQGLPLWTTFLSSLEASADVRRNTDLAIGGATAAFKLFLQRGDLPGHTGLPQCPTVPS